MLTFCCKYLCTLGPLGKLKGSRLPAETAMNMLYWSSLIYDYKEVMPLISASQSQLSVFSVFCQLSLCSGALRAWVYTWV